ncbi:hypothetical protein J3A83DRAFT_4399242, partial [Scleroderma citrinum]
MDLAQSLAHALGSSPAFQRPRPSHSSEIDPTVRVADNIKKLEKRVHSTLRKIEMASDPKNYVDKVVEDAKARARVAGPDDVDLAKFAQNRALQCLSSGIQPVALPNASEVAMAKEMVKFPDSLFHFGIAGATSNGKWICLSFDIELSHSVSDPITHGTQVSRDTVYTMVHPCTYSQNPIFSLKQIKFWQ